MPEFPNVVPLLVRAQTGYRLPPAHRDHLPLLLAQDSPRRRIPLLPPPLRLHPPLGAIHWSPSFRRLPHAGQQHPRLLLILPRRPPPHLRYPAHLRFQPRPSFLRRPRRLHPCLELPLPPRPRFPPLRRSLPRFLAPYSPSRA